MWPRTAEFMIACWLFVSPFVFGHQQDDYRFWWLDLGAGFLLAIFSLLSFWQPARRAHLLSPVLGITLIAVAFVTSSHPLPPPLQNHVIVGLLVMMTGIIPSDATLPPEAWREFDASRRAEDEAERRARARNERSSVA